MKIKRLAICAHPDDAEIFAINAIAKGDFALVVMSDGAGCAKGSGYEKMTEEELKELRKAEQQEAAEVGGYKRLYMLGLTSEKVREGGEKVEAMLSEIIDETMPDEVYIHNPFDSHPTHLGAFWRAFYALKKANHKVKKLYACEVWRGLDWFIGDEKVALDTSDTDEISDALMDKFASQNATKNYNLGAKGRRYANATFTGIREANKMKSFNWALDMTEYLGYDDNRLIAFIEDSLEEFKQTVLENTFKNMK